MRPIRSCLRESGYCLTQTQSPQEFTASFNALPGLKPGTLAALISIVAPVCGLRPVRAARSLVPNVPKPTNTTGSLFCNDSVMVSIIASITRAAAAFGKSALAATASISSDLFTVSPYFFKPVNCLSRWFFSDPVCSQHGSKILSRANCQAARGVPAASSGHLYQAAESRVNRNRRCQWVLTAFSSFTESLASLPAALVSVTASASGKGILSSASSST